MKRIPAIIALFLAVPLIAVAQHQQGNVANVPDQKFDVPAVSGPISSDFTSVSIGTVVSVGDVTVSKDFHQSVDVGSLTGRVVKLSDEEYTHLQKLRQVVTDEEKKIAAAHGVDFGQVYVPAPCIAYDMGCMAWDKTKEVQSRPADRWQFRGQWLLINVPRKETNQFSKQKTCGDTAILYVNQFGNPECVATPAPAKTTEPTKGTK